VTINLAAYFDRIQYTGPAEATLETLRKVTRSHTRAIPFENLDPLLGTPVADLSPRALEDKLVRRCRGGYCYEHNGLLQYALAGIGFEVHALASRVVWTNPEALDGPPSAQNHRMLAVRIPGDEDMYLADVGFGGPTLPTPIRLLVGPVQDTSHEPYRLRAYRDDGYLLEILIRNSWQPLYTFTNQPQPQVDLEVASWYVSTHPASKFVSGLFATRVGDNARYNLRGRNLAIHHLYADTEHIRFDTATQVLDILTDLYAVDLSGLDSDGSLEARVHAVLDT
jgi:arylamine N-acetyltransferase